MSNNKLEIYQQNSHTIDDVSVNFLTTLTGYDTYFTAKKYASSTTNEISNTGTITDVSLGFNLSYLDTSLNAGDYVYDITIESSSYKYTIIQDRLIIIDSIKY